MQEDTMPGPTLPGPRALDIPGFADEDDYGDMPPAGGGRPWWRQPRWIALIAGVLLVALLVGVVVARRANRAAPITYQFTTAQTGNLVLSISATGPIQSGIYNINFSGSGKIAAIDVKVGQTVTAGQALAQLDPTSLQDAVNQATAAVASARAGLAAAANSVATAQTSVASQQAASNTSQTQVAAAQINLQNAQTNLTNVQAVAQANLNTAYDTEQNALYNCANPPKGSVSPPNCVQLAQDQYAAAQAQANAQIAAAQAQSQSAQASLNTTQAQSNASQAQINTANAAVSNANSQVSTAQAQLASAQVSLATAQHNLANATLLAPHAGTVSAVNGVVGSSPGVTLAGTASPVFIQIADLSTTQIQASVNEADVANLAVGNTVSFNVSAYKARTFTGTVSAISPVGVTTANVVSYPVTIDVAVAQAQGANLLPGMTASVTIFTVRRTGVVLIPVAAVTFAANAGPTGAYKLLTRTQLRQALVKAAQMTRALATQDPTSAKDSPTPAFVVEKQGSAWTAVPVVLGLSDGSYDEVLAGLASGDQIADGRSGGTAATTTTGTSLFPGRFGGGAGGGRSGGAGGNGGKTSGNGG